MKRLSFRVIVVLGVVIPIAFYTGYIAHKERVFPLRPFLKRVLIEFGASPRLIEVLRGNQPPHLEFSVNNIEVNSVYYDFVGSVFDLPTSVGYGGIAQFREAIIFVDGHGLIWLFERGKFTKMNSEKIPNLAGVTNNASNRKRHPFAVVKDIALDGETLYASAIEYIAPEDCVKLSVFRVGITDLGSKQNRVGAWEKMFSTEPCLAGVEDGTLNMGEAGGRMVSLSASEILFSVGDFGQDGVTGEAMSQNASSHYGKTLKLDLSTFEAEIYTTGHRNPQGLVVANNGSVYSTEHGPHGGDELNLIKKGKNYGWPLVTFGVQYGTHSWPLDQGARDHSGYEKPLFSWVPSIGVSNVVQVENSALSYWSNDLLIASLFKVSLYRMRLSEHRPILIEPIYVGSRIRDIINYKEGFALQLDQENRLLIMEVAAVGGSDAVEKPPYAQNLPAADIYERKCGACHEAGAHGAPQTGKKSDWESRYRKGFETLVRNAAEGFRGMPAMSGDRNLSNADVAKTVVYMLEKSGIQVEERPNAMREQQRGEQAPE